MDGGRLHLREMKFFFFLSLFIPSVNLDFLSKKALEGTGFPPSPFKGKRKSLNFSSFFLLRLRKEKLEEEEARFTVGDGREAEGFFSDRFFFAVRII